MANLCTYHAYGVILDDTSYDDVKKEIKKKLGRYFPEGREFETRLIEGSFWNF